MSGRDAVVTGIGVVIGTCRGVDDLRASLTSGHLSAVEVDRSDGYHAADSSTSALLCDRAVLASWLSPGESRRMGHASKMAVASARMALADAGLSSPVRAPNAVVMATAFGAVAATERIVRTSLQESPDAVSPFDFSESVANAPAAHVAVASGAHGPSITLAQREAGGLTALGRAAEEISRSRAECVLAGSVDEMPPILHALLNTFGALARADDGGREQARPFDRRRNGFIAAEGATVLVVEPADAARTRAARVRARVRGHRSGFAPSAPRTGWAADPRPLIAQLAGFLADHDVTATDIDRIVSGASGSVAGDRLEAQVLRGVWGSRALPPILAPKRIVGEYGGGFLSAALLSREALSWSPAVDHAQSDARLGVVPYAGGEPLGASQLTLVQSLASGGSASWLLLQAPS